MLTKINNFGDTMIEVMMCLIVAGVVLGAAYTTARRNTIGIISSQERINALKVAETQAELIRNQSTAKFGATDFCFNTSNVNVSAPCTYDGIYTVRITPPATDPTPSNGVKTYNYKIVVLWPSFGVGNNNVTIFYSYAQ